MTATVYIVDDDPSVRSLLADSLASLGYRVLAFGSALEYLENGGADGPGCILLDLCMPGMDGLELQRRLSDTPRARPIVFLTDMCDVPTAVRAMREGAVDVLTKPPRLGELTGAVRRAVARDAQERRRRARAEAFCRRTERLSRREREILELLLVGLSNKEVGAKLDITVNTVKVHRSRLLKKLEAGSFARLLRMLQELNLLE